MRYLLAAAIVLSLAVQSPVQAQAGFDTKAVLASIDAKARGTATSRCRSGSSPRSATRSTKSSALPAGAVAERRLHGRQPAWPRFRRPSPPTWGSGKPVIGIVGEFDALPGSVAGRRARAASRSSPEGPGHGCGHHLFGTASTAAAIAVKEWLIANKHAGTLRFYGTPAEEGGAGKVYMLRAGLFDDVDAVVTMASGRSQRVERVEHASRTSAASSASAASRRTPPRRRTRTLGARCASRRWTPWST